jgi:hypothetical protein
VLALCCPSSIGSETRRDGYVAALISHDVQCFPTPREPTAGRRRGVHRLSQAFTFTARGGKARSADAGNTCWRMCALSTNGILPTCAITARRRSCSQAAATRRLPLIAHMFVVRAHFRQRSMFPEGPRADRQGGEGLSTALHKRSLSPPAVARPRSGRRGKNVLDDVRAVVADDAICSAPPTHLAFVRPTGLPCNKRWKLLRR